MPADYRTSPDTLKLSVIGCQGRDRIGALLHFELFFALLDVDVGAALAADAGLILVADAIGHLLAAVAARTNRDLLFAHVPRPCIARAYQGRSSSPQSKSRMNRRFPSSSPPGCWGSVQATKAVMGLDLG